MVGIAASCAEGCRPNLGQIRSTCAHAGLSRSLIPELLALVPELSVDEDGFFLGGGGWRSSALSPRLATLRPLAFTFGVLSASTRALLALSLPLLLASRTRALPRVSVLLQRQMRIVGESCGGGKPSASDWGATSRAPRVALSTHWALPPFSPTH